MRKFVLSASVFLSLAFSVQAEELIGLPELESSRRAIDSVAYNVETGFALSFREMLQGTSGGVLAFCSDREDVYVDCYDAALGLRSVTSLCSIDWPVFLGLIDMGQIGMVNPEHLPAGYQLTEKPKMMILRVPARGQPELVTLDRENDNTVGLTLCRKSLEASGRLKGALMDISRTKVVEQ